MAIKKFPNDFLWGSATSAYQVEGGNIWSDWHEFEKKPSKITNGDKCGLASDHYNRYKIDFDLAKNLNQNAHRLSIEWARIEKKKGVFDENEIKHYVDVLKSLKDNNFKTMVTLHHFTNPIWFSSEGGWSNKESVKYFIKYVQKIVPELNKYVDFWATINEPMVVLSHGYLTKNWAPGVFNPYKFLRAAINMKNAHIQSYKTIKSIFPDSSVGVVYNVGVTTNKSLMSSLIDYFRNWVFLDKLKNYNDYLGINYYFPSSNVKGSERTDMKWPIYPKGLSDSLSATYKRYRLPIYITENGIADKTDNKRREFILNHLLEVHNSIRQGVDVRGYFYWSLLDNFEWAEGFWPRFGLIEIDYMTQERKIRESAKFYQEVCKSGQLEII